jgi:hypothetical protein
MVNLENINCGEMKHSLLILFVLSFLGDLIAQKSSNSDVFFDSVLQENNFLVILDSTNAVNSPKKYQMDDSDCYFQVQGNYAVLSYRLRGKNDFASGKVYQTGKVKLGNSEMYELLSFQGDNKFDASNQGKRYYIAYRFLDASENDIEIVLCSNTFTPTRYFKAHRASDRERKQLVERSNQQNGADGF